MQIPVSDLIGHLNERIEVTMRRCIESSNMDAVETQYERGRFAALKQLVNWVEMEYGSDSHPSDSR